MSIAVLLLMTVLPGCSKILVEKGFPQTDGDITGLELTAVVELFRDEFGIPHVYAQNKKDLFFAQGFLHAQDRLWQMEVYRRLVSGTLSEIAGEKLVEMDEWSRLLGLAPMVDAMSKTLEGDELEMAQAYINGVNAFIEKNDDNLPIEFRSMKFSPARYELKDVFNVVVLNSWFLETNLRQEILALVTRNKLDLAGLADLMPSGPDAKIPEDAYFNSFRDLDIGPFLPSAESFFTAAAPYEGKGSNNWVVAKSDDGRPLLANDPHLGLSVPGVWYFCHLSTADGTYNVAGSSMAGAPGIVIGHNGHIAWGLTNVMTDIMDLFVFRTDPENPMVYYVKGKAHILESREESFVLPDGKIVSRFLFNTVQGPVITKVEKGRNAIVALKWFGTVPLDFIDDKTSKGITALNEASTVKEAFDAGQYIRLTGQNLVVADVDGNIGWHPFGAVPIRKGYSGRLPADGSGGEMDWTGFIPHDKLPSRLNPPEGWIATANQKTVDDQYPYSITYGWAAPYRYMRIADQVSKMKNPSRDDFAKLQLDVHSVQADLLCPKLANYKFSDSKAKKAQAMLNGWDHEVTADSSAAAVFEVFITMFVKNLVGDEMGDEMKWFYHTLGAAYLAPEVILDRPDSPLWDDLNTPETETPTQVLERSLIDAYDWLSEKLGDDPQDWKWGDFHQYFFAHPGASSPFTHRLLSRGPFPAPGDSCTVNDAGFDQGQGGYGVQEIPSLRFIAPLSDLTKSTIAGPMGQSGQPGHPHYDDLIEPWMTGKGVPLYYLRADVEKNAKSVLLLKP